MNKSLLKQLLFKINRFSSELNYGREIISDFVKQISDKWPNENVIRVLDVGCGSGKDLINVQKILLNKLNKKIELYGIDYREEDSINAKNIGIEIFTLDIEHEEFPFDSNYFNLIIANQVFEHIKEIFWVLSECSRVIRTNGHLIVGIPNIAALHNRFLLLMGKQPTCMHIVGPHVRGFTLKEFREFLETDDVFKVLKCGASNLFPLPQLFSRFTLKLFPGLGITLLFLCKRQDSDGNILKTIANKKFETNYLLGS
ncbi:MAG: methyltransferase domain-containing protein [Candidatus Aminicenantes bacterium]|nr:MAG: methyltransferase domain-containing protein [Candidatus Aminicenantes bacterium]